jgi:hypothetical protein
MSPATLPLVVAATSDSEISVSQGVTTASSLLLGHCLLHPLFCTGEVQAKKWEWVGRGVGGGEGMGDLWDSTGNVNEENT